MTSVTKPPIRLKLSTKDEACHRLVRLLMRAYYEKEHVAVIDCLLDLQVKQANKVTESDLSSALHLSPKLVREILHRLRQDQLVKSLQKNEMSKPTTEELTSKGKRKGYTRAPTLSFSWYIDFEHVVNVIKFRHWDIFEKLNKKVDKSDVYYICPTLDCDNHSPNRKRNVMDLLLDGTTDGIFRCDLCFTHNTLLNTKQATPLVPLSHNDIAADGSSSSRLVDPSENLKAKFNKQLGVILEQLRKVDTLLQEAQQNIRDAAQAGLSSSSIGIKGENGNIIQFVNPAPSSAASSSSSASAAAAAAASSSSSSSSAYPQQSMEDMISVDLTSTSSSNAADAAKRMKMENVIQNLAREPLPWDKNNPLSLQKVEEERKEQEKARQALVQQEQREKEEDEQKKFQLQYEEQLRKQHEAAVRAAQAEATGQVLPSEVESVMISVAGKQIELTQITQEDIDQMSPEEFDIYSQFAEQEEF